MVSLILITKRFLRKARKPVLHSNMSFDMSVSPNCTSESSREVARGKVGCDIKLFDAILILAAAMLLCGGAIKCACKNIKHLFW